MVVSRRADVCGEALPAAIRRMKETRSASRVTSSLYFSQPHTGHDDRQCAKQRKAGELADDRLLAEVGEPRAQRLGRRDAAGSDQECEDDAGNRAARD